MRTVITGYAIVELTLKIRASGSWGKECTLEQISKQARESAIAKLLEATNNSRDYTIVGVPKVTATMVEPI